MSWLSAAFGWIASLFGGTPKTDPVKVAQIQAAAVKACGFLPMAESVAALVAASNPAVITVSAIASQICKVVTSVPTAQPVMGLASMMGEAPPPPTWGTLNGVPIQGVFIR